MALRRQNSQGFVQKAMSAATTGMQYAAAAKTVYDVGRQIYSAGRVVAPMLAAAL
jgi:hypothetical protein